MERNESERIIPIRDLRTEEGAEDIADSAMMRPYVRLAEAIMTKQGLKEAVTEIGNFPPVREGAPKLVGSK
jgi:hypothetical protein